MTSMTLRRSLIFILVPLCLPVFASPLSMQTSPEYNVPGIGFDLSLSYGTAAVRHANGSYTTVAKIDAEPKYESMMRRLASQSSKHLHNPYAGVWEPIADTPRRWKRAFRKKLGLAASDDVGTIARLLSSLYAATAAALGERVESVVIARPHIGALYQEDLLDALEYAGLKELEVRGGYLPPSESAAAFAGAGLGLCESFFLPYRCREEETTLPIESVLSILYTRHGLAMGIDQYQSAYVKGFGEEQREKHWLIDWQVGSDAIAYLPSDDYYWLLIRGDLLELATQISDAELPITRVLLQGESAKDEIFVEKVKAFINEIQTQVPDYIDDDTLFNAAKGAAEFAYRGSADVTESPTTWLSVDL